MPGYLIGSLLADAVGRRTTASLSLLVAGGALLLSPNPNPNTNTNTNPNPNTNTNTNP